METEGPLLTERAYRLYARGSGIQRVGRQVRQRLDEALARLHEQGRVEVDRPGEGAGYEGGTIRLAGAPALRCGSVANAALKRFPWRNSVPCIRNCPVAEAVNDGEEIRRDVLARYGLTRMTAQVRAIFERM